MKINETLPTSTDNIYLEGVVYISSRGPSSRSSRWTHAARIFKNEI